MILKNILFSLLCLISLNSMAANLGTDDSTSGYNYNNTTSFTTSSNNKTGSCSVGTYDSSTGTCISTKTNFSCSILATDLGTIKLISKHEGQIVGSSKLTRTSLYWVVSGAYTTLADTGWVSGTSNMSFGYGGTTYFVGNSIVGAYYYNGLSCTD